MMPSSPAGTAAPAARRWSIPWRRRWQRQPTDPASVLIASTGAPVPATAIKRAITLSGGEPVAVVSIARVYGSSLGLPNPGLMPTQREIGDQRDLVARALADIEHAGAQARGQVAATRRPGRTIARVATARGARHVVLIAPQRPRWRLLVEGDLTREIGRRLASSATVEAITP